MKNTFRIMAAALFLVVGNTYANTQTLIAGTVEKPFTVNINGRFDMGGYSIHGDHGMGPKALGGNVGFNHYLGHDFEYGLNVYSGWATTLQGKLFAEAGKRDGFQAGANINARYMPFLSESIRFGGLASIGYGRLFGDAGRPMNDSFSFGDMNFEVGPSFMHQAMTNFAWGFGVTYGMTEMRFGTAKANPGAKQYSNLQTVRIPFNFVVQATECLDITLALDPAWRYLGEKHKFYHGLFYDVAAGVNLRF